MWKISIFLLMCEILPPSTGFPPNGMFGRRGGAVEQFIYGGGNKQDESRGKIFLR